MRQGDRGTDSPRPVFVDEDRVEDAVHRCPVLECSHGPGSSADLAEPSFDGVGGPDLPSPGKGPVAEAGEQIVGIVAQGGDGPGADALPVVGEAAGGGAQAPAAIDARSSRGPRRSGRGGTAGRGSAPVPRRSRCRRAGSRRSPSCRRGGSPAPPEPGARAGPAGPRRTGHPDRRYGSGPLQDVGSAVIHPVSRWRPAPPGPRAGCAPRARRRRQSGGQAARDTCRRSPGPASGRTPHQAPPPHPPHPPPS